MIIETRGLTKTFGSFRAVDGVSISIRQGSIHALVGENGAGKTTLLKLLFGLHEPTSGEIHLRGQKVVWRDSLDAIRAGLGMVQQHFTLVDELSCIDNIMLGAEEANWTGVLDRQKAIEKLEALLPSAILRVPWLEKIETLSVGQKQRVEILKLLFRNSEILFLDEPTAVLAPHEVQDFFDVLKKLKSKGKTIVIITHKLKEVFDLCDDFTVLRGGKVAGSGALELTSTDQLVEMMIGRPPKPVLHEGHGGASLAPVLQCRNLKDLTLERGGLRDVSLEVGAGEIVGIAGVEGSGQARLVEALLALRSAEGHLEVFGENLSQLSTRDVRELGVGLVPEDRLSEGLWPDESCFHNGVVGLEELFTKSGFLSESEIEEKTTSWFLGMDVRAGDFEAPVKSLSGGNQQKLILAREVVGRDARLVICHHPTRGVDLGAIENIHAVLVGLAKKGVAILVLSSDLDELMALSNRIYVLYEGSTVKEFARGEYDAFAIGKAMTGAAT